jgi:hypothetical protein
MEPGLAMYIWDVYMNDAGKWVVKASLIPKEVYPYLNNLEGKPADHNILTD